MGEDRRIEPDTDDPTFYARLPLLDSFIDATSLERYHPAPDDWAVVISDVEGSTRAIEAGRYKDVNAVGVASIVATQNALPGIALPFVFGGDGATVLVPESGLDAVRPALRGIRAKASSAFDLALRTGIIGIRELRAAGHEIAVARMRVSEHASFAMFAGDGFAVAEKWLKDPAHAARFAVSDEGPASADLRGFECRWQPLANRRGTIASLIIQARGDRRTAHETYRSVVAALESITEGRAPLTEASLVLASDPTAFRQESALRGGSAGSFGYRWSALRAKVQNVVGRRLLAKGSSFAGFDGARYRAEVVRNTDYRKFDSMLRMVLDLSTDELDAIEALLEERQRAGTLAFGVHRSSAALMTCIVHDYKGNHVHFVDGADGGYALAAKQLKARLP